MGEHKQFQTGGKVDIEVEVTTKVGVLWDPIKHPDKDTYVEEWARKIARRSIEKWQLGREFKIVGERTLVESGEAAETAEAAPAAPLSEAAP